MASRCRLTPALARRLDPPARRRVSTKVADVNLTGREEDPGSATKGRTTEIVITEDEEAVSDDDYTVRTNDLQHSKHRDGAMYRGIGRVYWKKESRVADRSETRLGAMMSSDPTEGWITRYNMLQFFSLKLAKISGDDGLVELYGYIAVRDDVDMLLNYVINISRNDPIIVEKGSLISVAGGPTRGLYMMNYAIIEYDMRIKRGRHERDDLQLIDGAKFLGYAGAPYGLPHKFHIFGDIGGAVNMTIARINHAVVAIVEVLISKVRNGFNMSLRCFTSGFDKEIRLFDGAVTESCGLKKSVVAIKWKSFIRLKFKVKEPSSGPESRRCCTFKAKTHGHKTREMKSNFALISVKVTWST